MPLFKVTQKRMAKRRKEDELGITALKAKLVEMGEMDDDEGGSGSGSGSGSDVGSDEEEEDEYEDEGDDESIGTMDDEEDTSDEEGSEGEDGEEDDEALEEGSAGEIDVQEDEEEEDDDESDDGFSLTIEEVSSQPIYPISSPANAYACVLCPGRILKNDHMVKEHLSSKAHKRSAKRWDMRISQATSGERPLTSDDPREIVDEIMEVVEQQRQGELVEAASSSKIEAGQAPQDNAGAAAVTSPKGAEEDTPADTPNKRKRKRRSAAQRKEAKAREMVAAAAAAGGSAPIASVGDGNEKKEKSQKSSRRKNVRSPQEGTNGESGEGIDGGVKLNRKARRLAAREAEAKLETTTKGGE